MAKKLIGADWHSEVTIDQVAKAANVSPATVSRVLNGTAKVSAEKEKQFAKRLQNTTSHLTQPPDD